MKKELFFIVFISAVFICGCQTGNEEQGVTAVASRGILIDGAKGSCPYLTRDDKNNIVLSWIKQKDSATFVFCYAVSEDEGKTFNNPIEIPGSANVHPHGENMPKVIFKPSGEVIAVWGAANPNPQNAYSGLVYYARSFDKGKTWTAPVSLTKDTASFDQRYFDVALLPGGEAGIVWLDNRKQSQKEGSGLYYAVTKGNNGFEHEQLISEPCCPCCRTDLFIDKKENIHVLYRAIINDSIRDMVHIVSTDKGHSFSLPKRISEDNWVISGCPHTGPAMTENREGLHFTWFSGGGSAGIYYNNSFNNGQLFSVRSNVSGSNSRHCQIASLSNDNIVIVWNESSRRGEDFNSRIGMEERNANGDVMRKAYITPGNSNASFPVICPVDANTTLVAYTERIEDSEYVMFKQVMLE
ncbi:sialidase family protein [Agriterribacter sp.]|uniref:sialidase family protein n=1 Tax=Agriterribacter sp. TaxID=2821509 RepID=UPI002CA5DA71|nr:sialidase family protein [Agriterribacter sp.]HRP55848.1 sialidase family protein [Agriterribacter sp.]